jgi:hypothetical protein
MGDTMTLQFRMIVSYDQSSDSGYIPLSIAAYWRTWRGLAYCAGLTVRDPIEEWRKLAKYYCELPCRVPPETLTGVTSRS